MRSTPSERQVIPVMHCFDNNYVIPAAASFNSMLEHADPDYDYQLYVLHTDITWKNQEKLKRLVSRFPNAFLEFIDMDHRFSDVWDDIVFSDHLTKEVLYKLIAPSIFRQYDKLIVTDVDVLFLGDIASSYFSFDASEDVYLAGVKHVLPRDSFLETYYENYTREFGPDALDELKVCGGYLVLNLNKLREDKMEKVFLEFLNANASRLFQSEQDVINFCCSEEKIVFLPLNYVVCSYCYDIFTTEEKYGSDANYAADQIRDALARPVQLHYATHIKPWNSPQSVMADKWFLALAKTEFYEDYLRIFMIKGKPSPEQITPESVWEGYRSVEPVTVVSVLCCTYNHSQFIRDTLSGIVRQRTKFPFEIIVSDDASTDDTQLIIQSFRDEYPHLFRKCILREKNVGIGYNYFEALNLVEGKYLAICDGDDYWIDPHKLQRQVDFLDRHENYTVCCSSFKIHHSDDKGKSDTIFRVNDYIRSSWMEKSCYGFVDLLNCRFIASCTMMLRWKLHNRIPDFLVNYRTIDFQLSLIHSAFGKIHVMNNHVTAQYNVHSGGITSDKENYYQAQETLHVIQEVNQLLGFRFTNDVQAFKEKVKSASKSQKKSEQIEAVSEPPKEQGQLEAVLVPQVVILQSNAPAPVGHLKQFYHNWLPTVLQRCFRGLRYVIKGVYRECMPLYIREIVAHKVIPRLKRILSPRKRK